TAPRRSARICGLCGRVRMFAAEPGPRNGVSAARSARPGLASCPVVEIPGDLDSDRARDLIKRARQIRRDAGIGMSQMADRVGVSKATLHAWETNPPAGLGRSPRT